MSSSHFRAIAILAWAIALASSLASTPYAAAPQALPEIRSSAGNPVSACVTPERLMVYLKARNPSFDPRHAGIAAWYKHYGEAWRVRWDYAFFQMALETNFLTYRRGNGRWGDVHPGQNNFAGIGTTGGGVPGDSFPEVKTGVLAHIQHLVAYSGERLADPVAPRTRLKQDDIVEVSLKLARPVRFSDLARRWAADRHYGRSIEWVAGKFREAHCRGREQDVAAAPPSSREALPWAEGTIPAGAPAPRATQKIAPRQAAGEGPSAPLPKEAAGPQEPPRTPPRCEIVTASYGGERTLLIRSEGGDAIRYTALTVVEGFEDSMASNYIRAHAPKGMAVGRFDTRDAALEKARELCPRA